MNIETGRTLADRIGHTISTQKIKEFGGSELAQWTITKGNERYTGDKYQILEKIENGTINGFRQALFFKRLYKGWKIERVLTPWEKIEGPYGYKKS